MTIAHLSEQDGHHAMSTQDFIVILPVRNGGAYIASAIDSVLDQTHQRWRLVILENCSSDDTDAILARYDDERITVLRSASSLPIEQNWHRAFEYLAATPYENALVTFLGHDDLLRPHFLSDITALAQKHPAATLYQTLFDLIDEAGHLIRPCRPVPASEAWPDLLASLCWNIRDSFGTGYAFRAADYLRVGGIPALPTLLYADHLLFTRLTRLGFKASTASSACASRYHRGSASGAPSAAKFDATLRALDQFHQALIDEFSAFAVTDLGRAAIAALLARELSVLTTPVLRRIQSPADQEKLAALQSAYSLLAGDVSADVLAVQPYGNAKMLVRLRQLNITRSFLAQRFGRLWR